LTVTSLSASPITRRSIRQPEYALVDHRLDGVLEVSQMAHSDVCGGPVPVAFEHLGVDVLSMPDLDHKGLVGSRDD
jgi:hypothetical protein